MEPQEVIYLLLCKLEPELTGRFFKKFCLNELTEMYVKKQISAKLFADTMVVVESKDK
jgi:hypothetical protein